VWICSTLRVTSQALHQHSFTICYVKRFSKLAYMFLFFCPFPSWRTAIFWDQWDDHPYTMRPRYLINLRLR
jgi:hypothetical protein